MEALQLAIQERDPTLPLGPQTALDDDERLLAAVGAISSLLLLGLMNLVP